ncbi:breast carcinoma amplified sequence 2 [Melanogaster broomeanus]|nr:breast carcinoma amplified sequence 2 [Melanogaster broomeanus]
MASLTDADPVQRTAIFDSLPYYDNDLEQYPILKEKVEKELAREPKPPQALHPLVPPPFELFQNNPLLAAELARVEGHQPLQPLDTLRYQLPAPMSSPGTDEEWRESLRNAHAQLEHQRLRQTNLALLQTYGQNAWRINNYLLEETAKQSEKALEELKQLTTELNRERKNSQTRYGAQLTSLETRWTELLSSILQIEMANVALDAEIDRLNKKRDRVGNHQRRKLLNNLSAQNFV